MNVTLVDSPFANVANIRRALTAAGAEVILSRDPAQIAAASKLVLPGVGSFAAAMGWLESSNLVDALRAAVARGSWLLGICVGHQLLFDESEEDGHTRGLGILPGRVQRFSTVLPVPQIGWNRVNSSEDPPNLFAGISDGTPFYFVNSYRVPEATSEIAFSDYGGRFAAAVWRERVFGVQFHPEKSSTAGLRLLQNFVEIG